LIAAAISLAAASALDALVEAMTTPSARLSPICNGLFPLPVFARFPRAFGPAAPLLSTSRIVPTGNWAKVL